MSEKVILQNKIINLLNNEPGLSDREITNIIKGFDKPQQAINQACRSLENTGFISREKRSDGLIGNFLTGQKPVDVLVKNKAYSPDNLGLSEDQIKAALEKYLTDKGWDVVIAWGKKQGIDIDANRESERWIMEVKGHGSRSQMRVNYFLAILGETLQRMNDPNAKYSIALPDMQQYRGLWDRLPELAKQRTGISMLFINMEGEISEVF